MIHTVTSLGFPDSSNGKESACNGRDLGLIPGLGRSPGEGNSYILQVVILKILKEIGIPDHLTCFLRNLYAGQEAAVRTGHGTTDWFQIRKGVHQGCIVSPCLFNLYAEYIMRNAWRKHKLESRLPGEISITSDMQVTPPLWQKVKRK